MAQKLTGGLCATGKQRGLEVREYGTGTGSRLLVAADGTVVARVDDVALAYLFAAAPDLLEALRIVLAHVTHEETTTASGPTLDAMRAVARCVRAAIAKATEVKW